MAAPVKRAPLAIPKTLVDDFDRGFTNHGINPYIETGAIVPSETVTSNQQYEESIYEDPDVLTQQLRPYEYDTGKVCLVFCFV